MSNLQEAPSHLIFVTYRGTHIELVKEVLASSGIEGSEKLPIADRNRSLTLLTRSAVDAESLAKGLLTDGSSVHFLCIAEGPVAFIARALGEGLKLREAADLWKREVTDILRLVRRNRAQSKLVMFEQFVADPSGLYEYLENQYDLKLEVKIKLENRNLEDSVFGVLAAYYVSQKMDLSDFASELEASAYPLKGRSKTLCLDCDAVAEIYRDESRELKNLRVDNESILHHLHQVQLELEDNFLRYKNEREQNSKLNQELIELSEEIKKIQENMKKNATAFERRIEAFQRSTSWRVTRPVRAIGLFLRRLFR